MSYYNLDRIKINPADLTSRLKKCLEIKERYPDAIVLFQSQDPLGADDDDDYGDGDDEDYDDEYRDIFYESYCFDAIEVALPADLVITYKLATASGDTEEFIHLVRFPDYGLRKVLRKLLKKDRKIVVVDWRSGRGKESKELRPYFIFPRLDLVMGETEIKSILEVTGYTGISSL